MGKSYSTTLVSDNKVGVSGDQLAPINTGEKNQQANGVGSLAAGGNITSNTTDARNFGTAAGGNDIGNNSTFIVESLSDEVALGALQSNIEVSRDALETNRQTSLFAMQTNLDATRAAIDGTVNVAGESFAFGGRVADSLDLAARQQYTATLQTINASNQTAQKAADTSEAIVRDALGKLAEQRAPEGVNLTRALTFIAIAAAAAWVLISFFRRHRSST